MHDNKHHIVQSCKWETSCELEEYGFPVQQKISNWSNTRFPFLLQEILEEFFPASETWRIEKLELDLGEVDFRQGRGYASREFFKSSPQSSFKSVSKRGEHRGWVRTGRKTQVRQLIYCRLI